MERAPSAAPIARAWARNACQRAGVETAAAGAALQIVSELVTNLVLHAGEADRGRLLLARRGGSVTVSVTQAGCPRAEIRPRTPGAGAENGRGLLLVEALSDRWDVTTDAGLTCVRARVTWPVPWLVLISSWGTDNALAFGSYTAAGTAADAADAYLRAEAGVIAEAGRGPGLPVRVRVWPFRDGRRPRRAAYDSDPRGAE